MAKKKLQNDVLFGEQDIITPEPGASSLADSSSTESFVDDAALRLLQTQEKLLSNYDLMQQKMDAGEKQIARLTQELKTYKDNQETFVKVVQEDYTFRFDISPESLEKVHGVLQEETNALKNGLYSRPQSRYSPFCYLLHKASLVLLPPVCSVDLIPISSLNI